MITIKLDNEIEYLIFIMLFENRKGLSRDSLVRKLKKLRTTIYDNLIKLINKKVNGIPYIHIYNIKTYKKGRPIKIFYIPKGIFNTFIEFIIK